MKVKYEFQGNADTEQKFLATLAGGQVPDLVMLEISRIPGFANSGALLPLDDLAAGPDGIDLKDFAAGLLAESKIGGKLYSLPQARSMPVFYYNKDMFKAAGIDATEAPKDWAAIRDAAIKLTKADGSAYGWGLRSATHGGTSRRRWRTTAPGLGAEAISAPQPSTRRNRRGAEWW